MLIELNFMRVKRIVIFRTLIPINDTINKRVPGYNSWKTK